MDELEQLRARYVLLVADLRRQWWECSLRGEGNSDLAQLIWSLRSTYQQMARTIELAQEGRGIVWLQDECSTHIRSSLQALTSEWAEGMPQGWLWFNRKKAALYRLTRWVATNAIRAQRQECQAWTGLDTSLTECQ